MPASVFWTYDSQGNVLSVTLPQGTVSYAYDNLGRLIKTMIGPANAPTTETDYTYDALGRLATVTTVEQNGVTLETLEETTYEYDLQGDLVQEDLPNGVVDQFTYDNTNRLTKETEDGPDSTPIAEFDYAYRADGLQATETDDFWFDNGGQNVEVTNNITYNYDALDRLIDEAFITNADQILGYDSSLPSNLRQSQSYEDQYAYDLDSNQVQKTTDLGVDVTVDETVTSTYDANDRILEQVDTVASGSTTTEFTYANNGTQQTAETVYAGTPENLGTIQSSQAYTYDLMGRMATATVTTYTDGVASQIEQLTYGYDTNGIRVSALDQIDTNADGTWDTQTLTEYLNDSNNFTGYTQVLRATQADPTTGQTLQITEYTIGLQQISQTTTPYTNGQPGAATTLYFGYDAHGSVRLLFNAAGAIATVAGLRQIFNYDAYGNPVGFNVATAATVYLYSGQQTDAATGLEYLRGRYYDPGIAAFPSLDPFGGDQSSPLSYNKYLYTQGDPVNGVDPAGRDFTLSGLLANLNTIAIEISSYVTPVIRAYQTVQRISDFIDLVRLFADGPSIISNLRREAQRFLDPKKFSEFSLGDLLYTFQAVLQDGVSQGLNGPFGTIVRYHGWRIGEAILSRETPQPNHLVLYLPTLPSRKFRRDTHVVSAKIRLAGFPVDVAFGGRGGRLWGIGFDLPKNQRNIKNSTYQLIRVDFGGLKPKDKKHGPPFAGNIQQSRQSPVLFHWQIPSSPSDARGGIATE